MILPPASAQPPRASGRLHAIPSRDAGNSSRDHALGRRAARRNAPLRNDASGPLTPLASLINERSSGPPSFAHECAFGGYYATTVAPTRGAEPPPPFAADERPQAGGRLDRALGGLVGVSDPRLLDVFETPKPALTALAPQVRLQDLMKIATPEELR